MGDAKADWGTHALGLSHCVLSGIGRALCAAQRAFSVSSGTIGDFLDVKETGFKLLESSPWDQPEIPSAMQSAVSSP